MQHEKCNANSGAEPPQEQGEAPRRILVVDDDRLVLAMLAKGLRQAGYATEEASSAEQALQIMAVSPSPPDIAVLDISMPGMSGVELARILREKTTIPFMFLSAYGDNEVVRAAATSGAVGYLVKPIDTAQLVPSIEAGLARAAEIAKLRHTEANLKIALNIGRETSIAIGILMERYRLNQSKAFDRLRAHARQQRRAVNDVAIELINALDALNQFNP